MNYGTKGHVDGARQAMAECEAIGVFKSRSYDTPDVGCATAAPAGQLIMVLRRLQQMESRAYDLSSLTQILADMALGARPEKDSDGKLQPGGNGFVEAMHQSLDAVNISLGRAEENLRRLHQSVEG